MLIKKVNINTTINTTETNGGKFSIEFLNATYAIPIAIGKQIHQKKRMPFVVNDNELLHLGQFQTLGFRSIQIFNLANELIIDWV